MPLVADQAGHCWSTRTDLSKNSIAKWDGIQHRTLNLLDTIMISFLRRVAVIQVFITLVFLSAGLSEEIEPKEGYPNVVIDFAWAAQFLSENLGVYLALTLAAATAVTVSALLRRARTQRVKRLRRLNGERSHTKNFEDVLRREHEIISDRRLELSSAEVTTFGVGTRKLTRKNKVKEIRDPDQTNIHRPMYDTVGLALSGGGIRSAAYCLGVLQALDNGVCQRSCPVPIRWRL